MRSGAIPMRFPNLPSSGKESFHEVWNEDVLELARWRINQSFSRATASLNSTGFHFRFPNGWLHAYVVLYSRHSGGNTLYEVGNKDVLELTQRMLNACLPRRWGYFRFNRAHIYFLSGQLHAYIVLHSRRSGGNTLYEVGNEDVLQLTQWVLMRKVRLKVTPHFLPVSDVWRKVQGSQFCQLLTSLTCTFAWPAKRWCFSSETGENYYSEEWDMKTRGQQASCAHITYSQCFNSQNSNTEVSLKIVCLCAFYYAYTDKRACQHSAAW